MPCTWRPYAEAKAPVVVTSRSSGTSLTPRPTNNGAALTMLVGRGSPGPRFLWPLDLARSHDVPGFGYVMALRPPGYAGLADLMVGRVDVGFRVVTTLGLELADSFLELHNDGLCYRDISFGNTFFDPETGAALICDIDNVGIDGESSASVRGTPYFMAPEVVRGDEPPSARTDLFSLAVLLFYLFTVHHPLEGRRAARLRLLEPGSAVRSVWRRASVRVRSARRLEPPGARAPRQRVGRLAGDPVAPPGALRSRLHRRRARPGERSCPRERMARGDGDGARRSHVLPAMREAELLRRRRDDVLVVRTRCRGSTTTARRSQPRRAQPRHAPLRGITSNGTTTSKPRSPPSTVILPNSTAGDCGT